MIRILMSSVAALALIACEQSAVQSEDTQAESPAVETVANPAAQVEASAESEAGALEQTESERLYAWFQEVFMDELSRSPQAQNYLGMISQPEDYGRWDDNTDEGVIEDFERGQARVVEMQDSFDYDALDDAAKVSYDFFVYQGENAARQHGVRESEYAFSPMLDSVSGLATFMINIHRVSEPVHAEGYISRLESIDDQIDILSQRALRRAENGVLLPLFAYPRLRSSAQSLISGAPFEGEGDNALYADFVAKVESLELGEEETNALLERGRTAIEDNFIPAIGRYIEALNTMEEDASETVGAWSLPDGEALYAAKIAQFSTRSDMTAEGIHQTGLAEVERIHGEMRDIMAEVGFEGSLAEFFEFMRTDPQFQLPNTDEGRAEYLRMSTEMIDGVMEIADQYFDTLPTTGLEVRAVEPWREATATGAFYNQPTLDGSRPGYYYVNLSNMADNPTYLSESLAYHEGAPGHHFQIALAQELPNVPMFQKLAWNSAYGEGWALYTEWLGKEMGFFTDPYMDFGRLSYEIFRAARLVVDTGIHHHQWTREQAIDYMLEVTPMTEGDITPEVERYIVWPGQALSYKIGMMTIQELRFKAQDELGENFRDGGFHDAVLTAGAIPLPLLEQRVNAWIDDVKAENG